MKPRNRAQPKKHSSPNQSEIEELVSFLPKLRSLKGKYTIKNAGIEKGSDGVHMLVGPEYVPVVIKFFDTAAKPCWSDYDYDPQRTAKMFEKKSVINNASLDQIRTMLTWCVRGERFCDGHWAAVLSSGRIFDLLERLPKIQKDQVKS
jgi:hypothetical protein